MRRCAAVLLALTAASGARSSRCPARCHERGTCDEHRGVCHCPLSHTGPDCSQLAMPACAFHNYTLVGKTYFMFELNRTRPNWLGAVPCACLEQAAAHHLLCPLQANQGGLVRGQCAVAVVCARAPPSLAQLAESPADATWVEAHMAFDPSRIRTGGTPFHLVVDRELDGGVAAVSAAHGVRPLPLRACGGARCGLRGTCEEREGVPRCRCLPGFAPAPARGGGGDARGEACALERPRKPPPPWSIAQRHAPVSASPQVRWNSEYPQPCPNACRGRGACDGLGFCKCPPGWWGLDCAIRLDPATGRPVHEGALLIDRDRPVYASMAASLRARRAEGAARGGRRQPVLPESSNDALLQRVLPARGTAAAPRRAAAPPASSRVRIYVYPLRPHLRWVNVRVYNQLPWALLELLLASAHVAPSAEDATHFFVPGATLPHWGGMAARFRAVLDGWRWVVDAAARARSPNQLVPVSGDRAWAEHWGRGVRPSLAGVPGAFNPSNRSAVLVALQYNGREDLLPDDRCDVCFVRGRDVMLPPLPSAADAYLGCAPLRERSPWACARAAGPPLAESAGGADERAARAARACRRARLVADRQWATQPKPKGPREKQTGGAAARAAARNGRGGGGGGAMAAAVAAGPERHARRRRRLLPRPRPKSPTSAHAPGAPRRAAPLLSSESEPSSLKGAKGATRVPAAREPPTARVPGAAREPSSLVFFAGAIQGRTELPPAPAAGGASAGAQGPARPQRQPADAVGAQLSLAEASELASEQWTAAGRSRAYKLRYRLPPSFRRNDRAYALDWRRLLSDLHARRAGWRVVNSAEPAAPGGGTRGRPVAKIDAMARAVFCAVPPGSSGGWGARYLPAALLGCVPVFVKPAPHADPFDEILDWRGAAVHAGTLAELASLHRNLSALAADARALAAKHAALERVWPALIWSTLYEGCLAPAPSPQVAGAVARASARGRARRRLLPRSQGRRPASGGHPKGVAIARSASVTATAAAHRPAPALQPVTDAWDALIRTLERRLGSDGSPR